MESINWFKLFISLLSLIYSFYFHAKCLLPKLSFNKDFKSKIFSDYLKKNKEVWSDDKIKYDNGAILVTNFVHHVGYTITDCIIG